MDEYFITCPRGLEEVTSNDINQYLSTNSSQDTGGVLFHASLQEMYRINLYSRTGMFVLKKMFISFRIRRFSI